MQLKEKVELSRLIIANAFAKYPRIFAACSFGKDSRVIVDLCRQINPDAKFVSIDTGYEFPETLAYAKQLVQETGMNLAWVKPSEAEKKKRFCK